VDCERPDRVFGGGWESVSVCGWGPGEFGGSEWATRALRSWSISWSGSRCCHVRPHHGQRMLDIRWVRWCYLRRCRSGRDYGLCSMVTFDTRSGGCRVDDSGAMVWARARGGCGRCELWDCSDTGSTSRDYYCWCFAVRRSRCGCRHQQHGSRWNCWTRVGWFACCNRDDVGICEGIPLLWKNKDRTGRRHRVDGYFRGTQMAK
jgi:hypothetical protein